jgi:N6-L-threonylcarbamoyladenine synthase
MKKGEHTYILGIESSCDETSASVCHNGKILSNIIAAQAIHTQYGGVVPELASRAHMQNIVPVVDQAMIDAGISLDQLDAIAFTSSPGLIGALLVGTGFAKSLALSLDIPLIAVHHMQAHVLSNLIADPQPEFPFLCLTVSGGHTQIVLCKDALNMEILGETLDDAAGEAFDKTALEKAKSNNDGVKQLIKNIEADNNGIEYVFIKPPEPIEGETNADGAPADAEKSASIVSGMASRAAGA